MKNTSDQTSIISSVLVSLPTLNLVSFSFAMKSIARTRRIRVISNIGISNAQFSINPDKYETGITVM